MDRMTHTGRSFRWGLLAAMLLTFAAPVAHAGIRPGDQVAVVIPFETDAEFAGDAQLLEDITEKVIRLVPSFVDVVRIADRAREEVSVKSCGGVDETICLCGMAQEKNAQWAVYGSLFRPSPEAPAILIVVLADAEKVVESKRITIILDKLDLLAKQTTLAACDVLAEKGCKASRELVAIYKSLEPAPAPVAPPARTESATPRAAKPPAAKDLNVEEIDEEEEEEEEEEDMALEDVQGRTRESKRDSGKKKDDTPWKPSPAAMKTSGYVITGVGGAVILGAGVTLLMAGLEYGNYRDGTVKAAVLNSKDKTKTYLKTTYALAGAGAAVLATGLCLWLLAPEEEAIGKLGPVAVTGVTPLAGPQSFGLGMGGTF